MDILLLMLDVCVRACVSECVCAGEGVACTQASRDPDWSVPVPVKRTYTKHSMEAECVPGSVLVSSVIVCALKTCSCSI